MLRQKKLSKFSTKFDPSAFRVIRKKGTMLTALRNGKYVTRNASLFKKVKSGSSQYEEEASDDESSDHDNDDQVEKFSDDESNDHDDDDRIENSPRRYPVRIRRPLQRYGQNVYEN